jgi:hypothetical protein
VNLKEKTNLQAETSKRTTLPLILKSKAQKETEKIVRMIRGHYGYTP